MRGRAAGAGLYEFQIAHGSQRSAQDLVGAVTTCFTDPDSEISARSVQLWEEHCTECAWPDCYRSCELYEARADGHCRRFVQGSVPVSGLPSTGCFVEFKRWGKLQADITPHLLPDRWVQPLERGTRALDAGSLALNRLTVAGRDQATVRLQTRLKRWLANSSGSATEPDYLLIELAPVTGTTTTLTVSVRAVDGGRVALQRRIELSEPFTRLRIPYDQILEVCGPASSYRIELTPNIDDPADEGLGILFGELGFVADELWERATAQQPADQQPAFVKAVIWDLDGTLWDGTLIEDQLAQLRLRQDIATQIVELDRRGIVNSVCSKNDPDQALAALEHFGLAEFIVFPAVSWNPKSQGVSQILSELNIGPDSVVFVDDQPFERAEVETSHPEVRVFDGSNPPDLVGRPEFNPSTSPDSAERRRRYQDEADRRLHMTESEGDYRQFLIDCQIEMQLLERPTQHSARVYELLQRTNQMNFSGRRLTAEELEKSLKDPLQESFLVQVADRFGDYGFVGFALVDLEDQSITDLAFSCRVQSKTIEHAVISHLLARYRDRGWTDLAVVYRPTERNGQVGGVFSDLGFVADSTTPERMTRATSPAPNVDTVTLRIGGEPA